MDAWRRLQDQFNDVRNREAFPSDAKFRGAIGPRTSFRSYSQFYITGDGDVLALSQTASTLISQEPWNWMLGSVAIPEPGTGGYHRAIAPWIIYVASVTDHPEAEFESWRSEAAGVPTTLFKGLIRNFAANSYRAIEGMICAPSQTQATQCAEPFTHSVDFTSFSYGGSVYEFSALSAACVKILVEHWRAGTPVVGGKYLLGEIESNSERLSTVFRDNPAWNRLIVECGKGRYRIAIPLATEPTDILMRKPTPKPSRASARKKTPARTKKRR